MSECTLQKSTPKGWLGSVVDTKTGIALDVAAVGVDFNEVKARQQKKIDEKKKFMEDTEKKISQFNANTPETTKEQTAIKLAGYKKEYEELTASMKAIEAAMK